MDTAQIKETILRELPAILEEDPEIQRLVLRLSREYFAGKTETESRFDYLLEELRRDREEQTRKWDEQTKEQNRRWAAQEQLWAEQNRRWATQEQLWVEQNRRWAEQHSRWEVQERKWDEQTKEQNRRWAEQHSRWEVQERKWDEQTKEQNRKWDEQNRKWDENQAAINQILNEIREMNRKYESSIGALGARWGLQSEAAFRDGLRAILEESFPVEVLNVLEYDAQGIVFGRPDQVELDLIIQNGMVIACEIKSSISKPEVYAFQRKVAFYEQLHQRPITRRLIISPMVQPQAKETAEQLGIEVYGYARDVAI